jgi:hypothetical protein
MVIYFVRQGEMLGQYPEDGVPRLVEAHAITASDYYWHEGMAEWASVSSSPWMIASPPAPVAVMSSSTKTAPGFAVAGMA